MIKRNLNKTLLLVLAAIVIYFWLTPISERNDYIAVAGFVVFVIGVIALAFRSNQTLRTWKGLGLLAGSHVAMQLWLQWRWDLWDSPLTLVRNLNTVATLGVFGTLTAMFIALPFLMVHKHASVTALTAAWIGYPILMIALSIHFKTFERFSAASFQEQLVVLPVLCLPIFLLMTGGIIFVASFLWLIGQELFPRAHAQH